MSNIPNGGSNQYLASGGTGYWSLANSSNSWPGDLVVQAEALNTNAALYTALGNVSRTSSGQYSYSFTVKNNGPNSTYYNIQNSFV